MNSTAGVMLVALVAFGVGFGLGRAAGPEAQTQARLARLEEGLALLAEGRPAARREAPPADVADRIDLSEAPVRGPADARVTIVEYSDFQCPFCMRANPTLDRLRETYPDDVRIVFKHFPLGFHKQAMNAHRAVLAAGRQQRFWEMHDRIFANPGSLDAVDMRDHAEALGLDLEAFDRDFDSDAVAAAIQRDIDEGRRLGVRGTPAFFVNGRLISGAQPYAVFEQRVQEILGAS